MIVYHEQVMRTLAALAGYDLTYADHIRRHLDDEEMLPGFRADFLERAVGARRRPRRRPSEAWDAVAEFASFGFCKAHAAAFAVPTYRSSWLKAHYPAHFLAGILTHDPGMYPRRLLLDDARRHDIPILPLDVNRERARVRGRGDRDGRVRHPARRCRTCTASARPRSARSCRARAERPFRDVGDFLRRTTVSRPVTEALAHAGAFDRLRADDPPARSRPEPPDHLYEAITTRPEREGDQLTLG